MAVREKYTPSNTQKSQKSQLTQKKVIKAEPTAKGVNKQQLGNYFNKTTEKSANPAPIPKPKKQQIKLDFSKSKAPAKKTNVEVGSKRPAPPTKRAPAKTTKPAVAKRTKVIDEEEKDKEIVKQKVSTLNLYSNAESDDDMEIDTKEPEVTPSPAKAFKKGKAIIDSDDESF